MSILRLCRLTGVRENEGARVVGTHLVPQLCDRKVEEGSSPLARKPVRKLPSEGEQKLFRV